MHRSYSVLVIITGISWSVPGVDNVLESKLAAGQVRPLDFVVLLIIIQLIFCRLFP